MTLRDQYVALLEAENEDLRDRLRLLEEMSGVSFEVPLAFGLTGKERAVFGCLLKNALVKREHLMRVVYPPPYDDVEMKILDVFVCKIRKKLKPFDVSIETQWGEGYFIAAEGKKKIAELLSGPAA